MYRVYEIIDTSNNKRYIGYTENEIAVRFTQHLSRSLLYHIKSSKLEQYIANIDDVNKLNINVIEDDIPTKAEAMRKESEYIRKFDTVNSGLNTNYGASCYNEGTVTKINNMYKNGKSLKDIGKIFHLSQNKVATILKNAFCYENIHPNGLIPPPFAIYQGVPFIIVPPGYYSPYAYYPMY